MLWNADPKSAGDQVDDETRAAISESAKKVQLASGAEVLFQEEDSRILLTPKGTLLFNLTSAPGKHGPHGCPIGDVGTEGAPGLTHTG